jgi:hypothetical protein
MAAHGLTDVVLPELAADDRQRAVELVDAVALLERDPGAAGLGEQSAAVARLLSEPLADELTRGAGMRFAALLHRAGAAPARRALGRLRASRRLADYVAALVEHRGALGAVVVEGPVSRRTAWRYLRATAPYAADVTAFAVAARLAAREGNGDAAVAPHLDAARRLLAAALDERARGVPGPLVRGDELVRELGATPGPELGRVLAQLAEDRYAGEVTTREDALARARALLR